MSIAIQVEGLGKRYAINRSVADNSLRDSFTRLLRRATLRPAMQSTVLDLNNTPVLPREFWALRDISFDVAEGERIGIIGANGAGKSTLLKILSRVTAPTEGRVMMRGKVASLLEVGTGFHPELSGRENVYLNGAVLGMSRAEIARKFDQIVEFSGVAKFLDTPVKWYSSGMFVRLAFSVSAWLDPDILIVDEVLSVGDQAFQKKCAERIKELTREGRTVLFVSHSMASVTQMCQKALYLENGRAVAFKRVDEATVDYQQDVIAAEVSSGSTTWHRAEFALPDKTIEVYAERTEAECLSGTVHTDDGDARTHFPIERPIHLTIRYRILRDIPYPVVPNFHITVDGNRLIISMPAELPQSRAGEYSATCVIPPFFLNSGRYTTLLSLTSFTERNPVQFAIVDGLRFEVVEDKQADPRRHGHSMPVPCLSRARFDWTCRPLVRHVD